MSDLQISNSFEKLRSFCIQICKAFFSKPLFRGRKFDLKFCTFLHYPKRGHYAFQVILFCSNGLINYRKIEYFWYTLISFGITPNFRSNLRPLNIDLEKNALHIWIQNEIWKSGKLWQMNNPTSDMLTFSKITLKSSKLGTNYRYLENCEWVGSLKVRGGPFSRNDYLLSSQDTL